MDPSSKEVQKLMGLDKKNDLSIDTKFSPMKRDQPIVTPKKFESEFKSNEKVKEAYAELFSYNNRQFQNSVFNNNIMRGYLRKRVNEVKIFQRTKYPKRYFVINFQAGKFNIY